MWSSVAGAGLLAGQVGRTRWKGKERDIIGFVNLGARYYEPRVGRFLSADPYGHEGSWDLYSYAGGDPINFLDADGRFFSRAMEGVHVGLDGIGLSPDLTVGVVADLINSALYTLEGDYKNARISLIAAVPVLGAAAIASKYAAKGAGAINTVNKKIGDRMVQKGVTTNKKNIGLSWDGAQSALTGMRKGGGHAIRHLEGKIIPSRGSLQSRVDVFKRLAAPILEHPTHAVNWRIGSTQGRAYLGVSKGQNIAIVIAKEGPHTGKVISSFIPDASQLKILTSR